MFSSELIVNIINYINNSDNNITIDSLSEKFHYEKSYIMKKFKKEINKTIVDYINYIKIYKSLKYFNINNSILKIALLSGFNSQEYYCELFKKYTKVSPMTYKQYISKFQDMNITDLNHIHNFLIEYENFNIFINNYLNNIKPQNKVYKKSIF